MCPNQAVIDVGALLKETRPDGIPCARLIVRNKKISLVSKCSVQPSDIHIVHLSERDLMFGLSTPKWNHIEDRICDLILEGVL